MKNPYMLFFLILFMHAANAQVTPSSCIQDGLHANSYNSTYNTFPCVATPQASSSTSGFLSSSDWSTFNGKQSAITTGTTLQYFRGDLSLATFPTDLSSFTNGPGYLTSAVTSVGFTDSTGLFNITGSPVTTTGTFNLSSFQNQSASTFLASPNGSTGAPTFRSIVAADVPTLNQNTTGSAATLATGRTISITGDISYTSPLFNGSSNVSAAGTLASVNSNIGTYQGITVNSKGLVTAASNQNYITLTGISASSPISYNNTTGVISCPTCATGTGYVTSLNGLTGAISLSSPNSTLTVGTSGSNVTADINLSNSNTWSASQTSPAWVTSGGTSSQFVKGDGSLDGNAYLTSLTGVTTFSAGTTGFSPASPTSGAITLGGTLGVANGGTGSTSFTANSIPYSNGTILTQDNAALSWNDGTGILNLKSGISFPANTVNITIANASSGTGSIFTQTGSAAANSTGGTGNSGGNLNYVAGAGGNNTAATTTNARGGAGASITLTGGVGGTSQSTNSGRAGSGGGVLLQGASGGNYVGTGTNGFAGVGGGITIIGGGSGGNTGGGNVTNGGGGGGVSIQGGSGAFITGVTSNGGSVFLDGGSSGGSGSSQPGNIILNSSLVAHGLTMIGSSTALTAQLGVISTSTTTPEIIAQAVTSQTADLQDWKSSGASTVAKVDISGNGTFASVISSACNSSTAFLKGDGSCDTNSYITNSNGLFVNNASNGTLTLSGTGPYTLGLNLGNSNVFTANQTAPAFVTSGGTSSQFVKGNGSLDGTSYYPSSNPNSYISLTALSGTSPISYNNATGVISCPGCLTSGSGVTTFSAGTTGFTPNTATSGAITLGGTLGVANGGTGSTSYTTNSIPYFDGTVLNQDNAALSWNDGTGILNLKSGIAFPANAVGITIANASSGTGSAISETGAAGASSSVANVGNAGGALNFVAGAGGPNTSATGLRGRGGFGGSLNFTGGAGGTSTTTNTGTPGGGGNIAFNGGAGANYIGSGTNATTGPGGNIIFTGGAAGTNSGTGAVTSAGAGGYLLFQGGSGTFISGITSNGGDVYFAGGFSGGSGSSRAGNIFLNNTNPILQGVTAIGTTTALAAQLGVMSISTTNPEIIAQAVTSQSADLQDWKSSGGSTLASVDINGNATAASFIKTGGTSSQFLKADGSTDSNSYYLASNPTAFIPLTALSATSPITYNNTTGGIACPSCITSAATTVSNSDGSLTISPTSGAVVASLNTGHSNTFSANQTINGLILTNGLNGGTRAASSAAPSASSFTEWVLTDESGSLSGFYKNGSTRSADGGGDAFNFYTDSGLFQIRAGGGINFLVGGYPGTSYGSLSTGGLWTFGTATIGTTGIGTFSSIVKSGGTSSQFLKADGSTDSNTYLTGNQTITLSGDLSGSGTTAITGTLATVNSNTGSFGSSTAIPSFTVNGKGLITAASTSAVVAPAGTLSGTTLNSTVVTSSLTSVGTVTSGTWNGTTIAIANGGTGTSSPGEVAGTGISLTGSFPTQHINSNAAYQISFQPGLWASVTTGKAGYHKVSAASTVDNLTISSDRFTCTVNPVVTMYECGTSTICASPTTIGSATLTAANTAVNAIVSSSSITAGDYVAWAVSAGTCTVLDVHGSAQVHAN